ncbi:hypothetical protein ACFFRR_009112 [Megaselia abdita]
MDKKVLYAFRGWIAFVAFMDLGTSFRSYVEKRSFIGDHTDNFIQGDYVISRIVGVYSFLKALVLVHCTLYIHHKPIVSMAICALIMTITLYLTEAFYFQSSTMNFYVIFPCVLNAITLMGLLYLPKRLRIWDPHYSADDENSQLLKMGIKKRRSKRV